MIMGWLFNNDTRTTQAETADGALRGVEVIARNKDGNAYYYAARVPVGEGSGYERDAEGKAVVCIVVLTQKSEGAWGYKDMDEQMVPYYFGASAKVLNALSATTHEGALKWREACRFEVNKKSVLKGVTKAGSKVRFIEGRYTGIRYGVKLDDKGGAFACYDETGRFVGRFRVTKWKESVEAVIDAIPTPEAA